MKRDTVRITGWLLLVLLLFSLSAQLAAEGDPALPDAVAPQVLAAADRTFAFQGDRVTLTVTVSGLDGAFTCRWQRRLDYGTWANVTLPGADAAVFAFSATPERLAYQYRAQVIHNGETYDSNIVAIQWATAPVITASASVAQATDGVTVSLTATAQGTHGETHYQWQRQSTSGEWVNAGYDGACTAVMAFAASQERLASAYRVQVTDDSGVWYSDPITVRYAPPPTVSVCASPAYAVVGETVSLAATAEDVCGAVGYRWEASADGDAWTVLTGIGSVSRTYSFVADEARCALSYRVAVTDQNGTWVSAAVRVPLIVPPVLTIQASADRVAENAEVTFSVTVTGVDGAPAYRWQASLDGETWEDVDLSLPGAATARLTLVSSAQTLSRRYRCAVTDNHRTWTSDSVGAVFVPAPTVSLPVIETSPGVSVAHRSIADYDYVSGGPLTIRWHADGGNGLYSVKALLLDHAPGFDAAEQTVVRELLNTRANTTEELTLSAADMASARYLKLLVVAQDARYDLNQGTASIQIGLRFMPAPQVAAPTVRTLPATAVPLAANTYTVYPVSGSALEVRWSADGGSGRYAVKALLVDNAPSFTAAERHIIKTVYAAETDATSFTVPANDLRLAKYLKVLITAYDAHHDQNAASASFQFALRLTDSPTLSETGTDGLRWSLTGDTLLISGAGRMADYAPSQAPWTPYRESIRALQIAAGVTSLGAYAFDGLSRLEDALLPGSLTDIAATAFGASCTACLWVPPYSVASQWAAAHQNAWQYLLPPFRADLVLPGECTAIGPEAFCGSGAQGVRLPEGVRAIGARAFADCPDLIQIYLPTSLTEIAEDAFAGVTALCVYAPADSAALRWAEACGYPCEALSLP